MLECNCTFQILHHKTGSKQAATLHLCIHLVFDVAMELLPLNPPSEKDIRCRLEQLDLNRAIPIEVVGEEPNEYLTMGGKKGSIKGPQKCNKVRII